MDVKLAVGYGARCSDLLRFSELRRGENGFQGVVMGLKNAEQNRFLDFFSRPIVGIVGSIASIVGFALSIYFFIASRESPELTYFVHPAKAAVVRVDQASGLSVQFDGRSLTGDVTATQVAFWNAGQKAIRQNSILQPLVLRTKNRARILEARIQKVSREVVGLTLDNSRLAYGEVGINWSILEKNDGGIVQIIYSGDEKVSIEAGAVLEGQSRIERLEYARSLSTPSERYAEMQGWRGWVPILAMLPGLAAIIYMLVLSVADGSTPRSTLWLRLTVVILAVVAFAWVAIDVIPPGPPFGF